MTSKRPKRLSRSGIFAGVVLCALLGGIVEIPVIDAPETRRVIGVIRRHEIIAAYNDAISRYREG